MAEGSQREGRLGHFESQVEGVSSRAGYKREVGRMWFLADRGRQTGWRADGWGLLGHDGRVHGLGLERAW